MDITGEQWLPSTPDVVWRALHDVDVLRVCVPGCQELTQTGPESYAGAASVGIGVIKGLYKGTLRLQEEREPDFVRVQVDAKSGHAEISGDGSLFLEPQRDGTLLRYEANARMRGPIAVVGQRLLPAATKSLAAKFFENLEGKLSATGES
jgi:hypothetical protein